MAAGDPQPVNLDLSVTSRPPSGKTDNLYRSGFQYRGRLFSASKQRNSQDYHSSSSTKINYNYQSDTQGSKTDSLQSVSSRPFQTQKPRKIQSATGRLERNKNHDATISSISHSRQNLQHLGEKRPSIVNLNVNDVPDCEEEMLLRMMYVRENSAKHKEKFLSTTPVRPSSAKMTVGSPVVKTEESSPILNASNKIKPSVYGLKVGRQVYGGAPEVLEAWKQANNDFPYKLSAENTANGVTDLVSKTERCVPSTLHPLEGWRQDTVPEYITGLDPSMCLIYLSHNYQDTVLPEVPTPQEPSDDLPYTCVVETPRQNVTKRYSHPFFENNHVHEVWKCKHNEGVFCNGATSSYKHQTGPRNSEEIRKEIAELEDLLNGIGSLTSNCSFVQFQAEIHQAKDLAAKLSFLKPRENQEEKDTFGLLKLYRDHEKIIAELHQRRNECLQELSLIEDS